MKVQLQKDPLFEVKDSPVKELKEKELERQREIRIQKMNPSHKKKQLDIQIIDPLPQELKQYKNQTSFKRSFDNSKARAHLKKYIIQQQKNLKCLRLERMDDAVQNLELSPRAKGNMDMGFLKNKDDEKAMKNINIPKIQDLFKNQQRQYVLYENKVLENRLSKAISSIETNVKEIKTLPFAGKTAPVTQLKRTTQLQKFPRISTATAQNNIDDDIQIDKKIQRRMNLSEKLRERLYRQKKQMTSHQSKEVAQSKNMSYFISIPKKQKTKILLAGVKPLPFKDGDRKLKLTPASSLLFELSRLSNGREKKEHELGGLLKNSFQNRDSVLMEKSHFYDSQTPFKDLTPSNQYKLRQLMDKKLMRRLELSREQINNFTDYLFEIKDYHVILNNTILEILKEIRQALLSGKVMKRSDLAEILKAKQEQELEGYPNELIITKLFDMMI